MNELVAKLAGSVGFGIAKSGRTISRTRLGLAHPHGASASTLGWLERWYADQPTARVVGCLIDVGSDCLSLDRLIASLDRLRARHPRALDSTIDSRPASRRFPKGRLGSARHLSSAGSRRLPFRVADHHDPWAEAETELVRPFDSGDLLWRVVLVDQMLIATFHHVIADGHSVAIWARELVASLKGSPLAPRADSDVCLDARLDLRPTLADLLGELHSTPRDFERGGERITDEPFRTGLRCWVASPDLLAVLVSRAREARTSIHAVLCTAGLVASAASLSGSGASLSGSGASLSGSGASLSGSGASLSGFPFAARLESPVSLRLYCDPTPTGLGAFNGSVVDDYQLSGDESFWRFAADYRQRLVDTIPNAHRKLGLLRFAGDLRALGERMEREHRNARVATLEVSNIGRLTGLAHYPFWLFQGNHYHGPVYNLTVATCAETGTLRATLAVPAPLVTAGQADRFLTALETVLECAAAGDATLGDLALRGARGPVAS